MPLRSNPVAQWTEPPDSGVAIPIVAGYSQEVAPGNFQLTIDSSLATHGFNDQGDHVLSEPVPLVDLDGSARLFAKSATFIIMG